jgi:DNA-binding MarR family transcriptional regulator
MTSEQRDSLNHFFVTTFNKIGMMEESALKRSGCSDLTLKELHTIEAVAELEEEGRNTMSQIAARLSISVGALTTAIQTLVKKGYLERRRPQNDHRIVQVFLTENGRAAECRHRGFHEEMVQSIGDSLSGDRLDSLIASLKLLSEFFENKSEEIRS